MILKQYYLGCLAHASYLIADTTAGVAAVVDPQRDVDQYEQDARGLRVSIRHVFLTHFHADFVAGHLELRDRAGATIHLGRRAQAEYAFAAMKDGDEVRFGDVVLRALETPGHTPEGISLLVFDLEKDATAPHAVLTGDTLFIGDVGRPDLMASEGITSAELAGLLYDSLRIKLLALPDETLVYPAHGAGSMCGKNLSTDTVSTIGAQRRYNHALQPMRKEAFVTLVTTDQPEAPSYFSHDAALNRRERATLEASLDRSSRPLTLEDVLRLRNAGATLLDVREPAEFAGAHLAGSVNIGLAGKFATWAGTLLSREAPIIIVAEPGREHEAAIRLGRIGFDQVAGYLGGGMVALAGRADLVRRIDRTTAATLAEQLASHEPPLVLDVRGEKEWAEKRIEGSLNLPLNRLGERIDEISRGRSIVVHCASGYRSSIAAGLLLARGLTGVADLIGGLAAWESAHLPAAVGGP